ncbi:MAG: hypothetical protein ACTSUB_04605 [Candidatus Thorarchaeota archaeon]
MDIDKLLLKLLMKQENRNELGQIRYEEARASLKIKGFSERELRSLWIDGVSDLVWKTENGERVQWCYLIPEWEKSPEYREAIEKSIEKSLEKDSNWRLDEYEE